MKSMERLYREFYQKNIDTDKEKEIMNMVDFASILSMREEDFSKDTVMDFIYSNSPLARQMKLADFKDYFDNVCEGANYDWKKTEKRDNSKETRENLLTIYKNISKDLAAEYEECYFNLDIKILNILLNRGFTFGEVDSYFTENNYFGKRVYDKAIINGYAERVIEKIRSVRSEKMQAEMANAEKKYNEVKEILANNYIEGEKISQTQRDGEIALTLLVTEDFMPETVLKVVFERSEEKNKENIIKIVNDCNKIKRTYIEISEADNFEDATNFESLYFSYIKKYMEQNTLTKLTFEDDCQIAKEILNGLSKEGKASDHYIKTNLAEYSPITLEPWRNKENYIISVFNQINMEDSKRINKKELYHIEMSFKNIRSEIDAESEEYKSSLTSKNYRIALSIRELFLSHYNEEDIKEMFYRSLGIKLAKDKNQLVFLIDKAKKMLQAENELKNTSFKRGLSLKIISNNYISDVKKNGFTVFDVYKLILERKIYDTPSVSNRLYEVFLDIDMAESCLSRYRDLDKEELKEIINKSPRAILLSNLDIPEAKDYADNVIKKAEERLKKTNEIQYEKETMESLFYQETDIINQGINISEKLENPYQYCKGALKLFLKGGDELSIRETILNLASKFKIKDPESFTDKIMINVKMIYRRMLNIKNYEEDSEIENSAEKEYMRIMREKYLINSSLKPSTDVDAIAEMLNTFSKQEIFSAVYKNSPWTIEPGRNEKYVTHYLIPQADSKRLSIKKKLAKGKPIPRKDKREDIFEEYRELQTKIRKQYPIISYESKMEELVVASLALEKFNLESIKDLLDAYSPFKDSQSNYGENMINRISNIYLSCKSEE